MVKSQSSHCGPVPGMGLLQGQAELWNAPRPRFWAGQKDDSKELMEQESSMSRLKSERI